VSARTLIAGRPRLRAVAAASAAGALVSFAGTTPMAFASVAEGDDVDVVNTETVQVYMSADGDIVSKRVYEQLVMTGSGSVDIENPVAEEGLRNLDGFSGFSIKEGKQVSEFDVDGVARARTVSDYDGKLPLDIDVVYKLDGKEVEPGDVVGADGELEVLFTVRNVTGEDREVEVPDGKGGTVTRTVNVPLPMVGSLTTVAPDTFSDVTSTQANMAGDGRGGTRMSFTMTLFPPIGSDTATFGYTARVENAVVPRVDVSALPVNPLESPTFKTAATSYQGGADTGAELAAGATEIDTNLLKLRDGASDLLAGLLKLHAGSEELQAGLSGEAAPGARKLRDGAGDLDEGLGKLDDGAGRLSDGAGRLSAGAGTALSGSQKLHDGLALISGGLGQLAEQKEGLPAAATGVDLLKSGVDKILAGFGAVGQDETLLDGLAKIETGATQLNAGSTQLKGGLTQLRGDGSAATPGLVGAKGGVDQVKSGLDASLAAGGSLDQLVGGLNALLGLDCGPICQSVITSQILPGVQNSRTNLQAASAGLGQISVGLASAVAGLNTQLIPGAAAIEAGTAQLAAGAGKATEGAVKLKGGTQLVRNGLEQLDVGLTKAVTGVLKLDAGASDAYDGSGDLAAGLGRLDTGAGDLADGAGELADGAGDAHDGSGLIAAGAGDLADGLDDAAEGSGRLADGLGEAADGAPKLVDGAGRLSDEGTKVIAGKGAETAVNYGELYGTLQAGSDRAEAESMAFGAPEGAAGLTAYTFVIKGEDGETGRNWMRAVAGLGLLAAGGGVLAYRRRLI
jgi:putative membrane protein